MIRILLADDHPVIRKGISKSLKDFSKLFLIDEVDNAKDAIKRAEKNDYELIFLDISMHDGGGLMALEQIMIIKPESNIIILSIYDEIQYVTHSLKLGAKAYLTKSISTDELEQAVKKVRAGEKYICFELAERIALKENDDTNSTKHEKLSNREFQIFYLISEGCKPSKIAKDLSISPKTVGTHRRRILRKMNFYSTRDIIKYSLMNNLIKKNDDVIQK